MNQLGAVRQDDVQDCLQAGATIEDLIVSGLLSDDLDVVEQQKLERIEAVQRSFAALPDRLLDDVGLEF